MVSKVIDTLIVFRILKLLTRKWNQQKAYKLGIIDNKGKPLKKSSELETTQEKNAYTLLHRLVFNLKRIIEKLPFGRLQLTSYIAALALIKEHVEDVSSEFTAQRLMEGIEGRFDVPSLLLSEMKHDISTKKGYLDAMEEALMKEMSVVGGNALTGVGISGDGNPPETIVVPKKNKKNSPILNYLKR